MRKKSSHSLTSASFTFLSGLLLLWLDYEHGYASRIIINEKIVGQAFA